MTLSESSTSEDTPRDVSEELRTAVLELQRLAIEDVLAEGEVAAFSGGSCIIGSCNAVQQ
jgi:hypothetical protein